MSRLTIFTWGYWGWGNATKQLVQVVDSVEASRGFEPPVFVDIRIRRAVRAKGFNGGAFGKLVGKGRYVHMPALGNLAVLGHPGPVIQIKDQSEAAGLLDMAAKVAQENRRIIFFCACEYPGLEGEDNACHRTTVGGLVLQAAQQRQVPIEVVEWPGGEPRLPKISLPASVAQKLLRGGKSVPLGEALPEGEFAGIAPGSVVRVHSVSDDFALMVGSLRYGRDGWYLPALSTRACEDEAPSALVAEARQWRHAHGFDPRLS